MVGKNGSSCDMVALVNWESKNRGGLDPPELFECRNLLTYSDVVLSGLVAILWMILRKFDFEEQTGFLLREAYKKICDAH